MRPVEKKFPIGSNLRMNDWEDVTRSHGCFKCEHRHKYHHVIGYDENSREAVVVDLECKDGKGIQVGPFKNKCFVFTKP